MTKVFVSIGSNIEREKNILSGIATLDAHFGPLIQSSIYESLAFGFEGPNFYNLVVGFDTGLSLLDVHSLLKAIELEHGRPIDSPSFVSRTLDLDLLLYGDLISNENGIELPRSDIFKYAFVLCPLAEIAGNLYNPQFKKCYRDLWRDFAKRDPEVWKVSLEGVSA